ncbi:MAG TPA: hypothetical protein VF656_20115 [Pyrinomonadaceae bacterium]|jgi:hypothetical protein
MKAKRIKLLLSAIGLCLVLCQPGQAQKDEDWLWVDEHFQDVLTELLPIEETFLGYRSYRDLYTDVLEYSFIYKREPNDDRLFLVVRMADSVSLYDQMMALHMKNRAENIKSIKKKLKVKEWRVDDKSCVPSKTAHEEFYDLSLSMLSATDRAERAKGTVTITLHPTVHTFYALISGGEMKLEITDADHPFVDWAKRTRSAVEKCIAPNAQPTSIKSQ